MRYFLTIISLFFFALINAQQFSLPSQPNRNMVYINPAFTGYYETMVASLMHRSNLVDFEGNLSFQNVEIHAPLKNQSVALGLQAMHEQIGPNSTNEIFFNYCHRIPMGKSKLVFGLKVGAISSTLGEVRLQSVEIDPAFPANSYVLPDFGIGFAYYSRSYYVGLSIPYLLGVSAGNDGNATISAPDINEFDFVLSAGCKIPISGNLKIEPHIVYVQCLAIDPLFEVAANISLNDKLILGTGYRSEKAFIANLGYFVNNQISLQYSYDYNIGIVGDYSKGSHEIGLLFYFGYKVKTVGPRDF